MDLAPAGPFTSPAEHPPTLDGRALSRHGLMLLGYQRTRNISRNSRLAWEAGDDGPLAAEVAARGEEIFSGAVAEIWQEYRPMRDYLRATGRHPATAIDIGCGQAIADAFLLRDFGCHLTLVDIEQTEGQYHLWNDQGSGYASLAEARAFLQANGASPDRLVTVNPRHTPEAVAALSADLVTSSYSCGFHYPIAEYLGLMLATVAQGGVVVLDMRRRYQRNPDSALTSLLSESRQSVISEEPKAQRVAFHL